MLFGFEDMRVMDEGPEATLARARRSSDGARVLLKSARAQGGDTADGASLAHEHEVLRGLDVPGVVRAIELVDGESGPVLVLEDSGAEPLRREVVPGGMPIARFLAIAPQIATLLGRVHRARVAHKAIGPASILVHPSTGAVQLIDFSASRRLTHTLGGYTTEDTMPISSEPQGGLDRRLDLRALGATFYELLTGGPPIDAENAAIPPPHELRRDIPPALSAIVMKLFAGRAEERYDTAFGVAHDLDEVRRRIDEGMTGAAPHPRDAARLAIPAADAPAGLLLAAYARAAAGAVEVVTVTGPPGAGKSALLHEIHKPAAARGGYCIAGSFGGPEGAAAQSPIAAGFRELTRKIQAAGGPDAIELGRRLAATLADDAGALVGEIPELDTMLDHAPTLVDLPAADARARRASAFTRFAQAFSRPGHPLTIALDDAHLADRESLDLLVGLAANASTRALLIAIAYRDGALGPAHPVPAAIAALEVARVAVTEIPLDPLDSAPLDEVRDDHLDPGRRLEQKLRSRTRELKDTRAELASALHQLRETQKQLVSQEKLASLGALTAGIAHEIKNPLNFVNNFAELSVGLIDTLVDDLRTQRGRLDPDTLADIDETLAFLRQNVSKINEHGKRADTIVSGMLVHSRNSSGARAPADLNAILADSVNLAFHGMRAKDPGFNVTIDASYDRAIGSVDLVSADLNRVFINIINNAWYAMREKQRTASAPFTARLGVSTRAVGARVEVRIRDNGTGIPPDVVAKIFDPFFTTKPAGEGTGLGMSISNEIIVKGHQGTLAIDTALGDHTEFIITLPIKAPPSAPPSG